MRRSGKFEQRKYSCNVKYLENCAFLRGQTKEEEEEEDKDEGDYEEDEKKVGRPMRE